MATNSLICTPSCPIAVVGIAAEFPSGDSSQKNLDHSTFFDFLLKGGQSYERVPLERFNIDVLQGSEPGRVVLERGSFLKSIDAFDYLEFGITHKDALSMSPSTRKLLELSFLSLLDSGIPYRGKNIGCFAAGIIHDVLALGDADEFEARGSFAGIPTQIANKISYHLDLTGPSVPVDTACSSTLTAMHLAIQAIHAGDCDAALVGGCQLNQRYLDFVQYTQGGVLAPDGKCKPFDASADGFSRGEAAAVVVIKPLEAALRDKDKIYATILGTGINSAGSVAPANAPVAQAQEEAMRRAYSQAHRDPQNTCYVEMHATGTATGDPVEANWVGKAFKRPSNDSELLVGSVKGNIGHTEITAFLASLCKVVGILEHGLIPPNVNLHKLNPAIHWNEYNMHVPIVPTPLPVRGGTQSVQISIASSGIGGSNGHCVIEAPPRRSPGDSSWPCTMGPVLLTVGALSPKSTTSLCTSFDALLKRYPNQACSLSVLLGRRSRQMTWRSFTVLDTGADAKVEFTTPVLVPRSSPIIGFVFSGQGPQHINMGRQLFRDFPVFRDSVLAMDMIYTRTTGRSLLSSTGLFDMQQTETSLPEIWPISIILPSIAIIQVALVDLLRSWGIVPDVVVGHSAGETAMLYACGSVTKEVAIEIAIARGQALQKTESSETTMAAISCDAAAVSVIISEVRARLANGVLEIACYNEDYAVTVAGNTSLINNLVDECKSRGISAQRLRTNVAVHSSIMDLCKSELRSQIQSIFDRHGVTSNSTSKIPAYSCATGNRIDGTLDADYIWRNTRQPVLFGDCVKNIVKAYSDKRLTFVEIGPHPVLSGYLSSLLPENSTILSPMRRTKLPSYNHERTVILRAIGGLACSGYNEIDFSALNGNYDHVVPFDLPPYPFVPKLIPVTSRHRGQDQVLRDWKGPLNFTRLRMNTATHPDLAEHVMNGEPIVPATGFLEMALEFGASALWNIQFHTFLSLASEEPRPVRVSLEGTHWSVSSPRRDDGSVTQSYKLHAEGQLLYEPTMECNLPCIDVPAVKSRCQRLNTHGLYNELLHFAAYGPTFRLIKDFYRGDNEFLVEVDSRRDDSLHYRKHYRLDPAILDACLHILVHPLITGSTDQSTYYLPSRCDRFFLYNEGTKFTERLFAYGSRGRWTPDSLTYDIIVVNSDNLPICAFHGLTVIVHFQSRKSSFGFALNYESVGSLQLDGPGSGVSTPELSYRKPNSDIFFLRYRLRDNFTAVLNSLKQIDWSGLSEVWLFAALGYNAATLKGLSRSLRREVPCRIRLVEMEKEWSLQHERIIVEHLKSAQINEEEIVIDASGSILAPRLRQLATVTGITPEPTANSKHLKQFEYSHASDLHLEGGFIQLEDVYCAPSVERICSFIGITPSGTRVVGITEKTAAKALSIPECRVTPLIQDQIKAPRQISHYALASIALFLACGQPSSILEGLSILITHCDTSIALQIQGLLSAHHVPFQTLKSQATIADVLHHASFDIILSGFTDQTDLAVLRNVYPTSTTFFWNSVSEGLPALLQQPHRAKMAMDGLYSWLSKTPTYTNGHATPLSSLDQDCGPAVPHQPSIFNGYVGYLLIGGIGSLGLQVAAWMYHNGARCIALTSRSGRETLIRTKNVHALRILDYLESLTDLKLILASCDASNKRDTKDLVANLPLPLGGCMLLAAVLDDQPFESQSQHSFDNVFAAKVGAYHALSEAVDIDTLEFLVGLTSISGMFGNAGQTNYASANTALESLISRHRNAFCLVTPMVLDTSIAFGDLSKGSTRNVKVRHIAAWGVSCRDVCGYIGDGLHHLKQNPISLYVPDMDWSAIHERMGSSNFFAHLIPVKKERSDGGADAETPIDSVRNIVLRILEITLEDFSPEVPLTSYGLDSLSAQRLVAMIRPYVHVTQLQLLADMSYNDIVARISTSEPADVSNASQPKFIDWITSKDPIVLLNVGEGIPIFLIPGASGTPDVFTDIAERLSSPVYGIHIRPESPDTLPDLANYLFTCIKEIQPNGPYRLGGFCVGTTVTLLLVEKFLQAGDELRQVALIEGFPMLFASPAWEVDEATVRDRCLSKSLEQHTLDFLLTMYATEPTSPKAFDYKRIADQTTRAINGESVTPFFAYRLVNIRRSARAHGHFVSGFADPSQPFDPRMVQQGMIKWLSSFKQPMTFYVGEEGIRCSFPNRTSEWDHLGVDLCDANIRIKKFNTGHFSMLGLENLLSALENDW